MLSGGQGGAAGDASSGNTDAHGLPPEVQAWEQCLVEQGRVPAQHFQLQMNARSGKLACVLCQHLRLAGKRLLLLTSSC